VRGAEMLVHCPDVDARHELLSANCQV
jgi:hypothetical protein